MSNAAYPLLNGLLVLGNLNGLNQGNRVCRTNVRRRGTMLIRTRNRNVIGVLLRL